MIDEIIKEMNICIDNNCYMAALSLALMLPDICGKAEYPNRKTTERYKKWYYEYVGKFEKINDSKVDIPYLSDELVYSLRCSILHSGNPSIDNKKKDIPYFELIWREYEGSSIVTGLASARIIEKDGKEIAIDKHFSVNIRRICAITSSAAMRYYEKNKGKFNFFNYHIENMDFRTRKIFNLNHFYCLREKYPKHKNGDNS